MEPSVSSESSEDSLDLSPVREALPDPSEDGGDADQPPDVDESAADTEPLGSYGALVRYIARKTFDKELRPEQVSACVKCLDPTECGGRVLLDLRTGYGKSLVAQIVTTLSTGVNLVVIPLLSLSADQVAGWDSIESPIGTVDVQNLDAFPKNNDEAFKNVIDAIDKMDGSSKRTLVLLASPQFIAAPGNKAVLKSILEANKRRVLRSVVVDEAHLLAQQSVFRIAIRMLKDLLFAPIFPTGKEKDWPILLVMSATITTRSREKIEELIGVKFPDRCRLDLGHDHYSQRNIRLEYYLSGQHAAYLEWIAAYLENEENDSEQCVIFSTNSSSTISLADKLTAKLNDRGLNCDVVVINGDMDKFDKFEHMNSFGGSTMYDNYNPRVLSTNGSGNTGISNDNVTFILRIGLPLNLETLFQEIGRSCRQEGMDGRVVLVFDLKSLVQNIFLLNTQGRDKPDSAADDILGDNSAIRSSKSSLVNKSSSGETSSSEMAGLTNATVKKYKVDEAMVGEEKKRQLIEVLKFVFLPGSDEACWHARKERCLCTGMLDGRLDEGVVIEPCGDACPMCVNKTSKWSWYYHHKPAKKSELVKWLRSNDCTSKMPLSAGDFRSLPDLLWKQKDYWLPRIFPTVSTVQRKHVEALMLTLIAAEIITWVYKGDEIQWILNETDEKQKCYEIEDYWEGVLVR